MIHDSKKVDDFSVHIQKQNTGNLFNDVFDSLADFFPLARHAGVLFALQDTLVLGQLGFALNHLEVTLDS